MGSDVWTYKNIHNVERNSTVPGRFSVGTILFVKVDASGLK